MPWMLALVALSFLAPPAARGGKLGVVNWFGGPYFSATAKAKAEERWVLVAFWVDGSPWCKRLTDDTFDNVDVATALDDLVCLNVDLSRHADGRLVDPKAESFTRRFPVAILPSMFFVSPEGRLEDLLTGYVPPAPFLVELQRIMDGQGTLSGLERAVSKTPDDIALRLSLVQKLEDLGDLEGRDAQLEAARALDPEERSLPMRRRKLTLVRSEMVSKFDDAQGSYDTQPLETFLESEEHPELLYDGWYYLFDLYPRIGRPGDARRAGRRAWASVTPDRSMEFGAALARTFWQQRDELSKSERRFALDVAERVAKAANDRVEEPEVLAALLDPLACCYYMNGKHALAVRTIERCIELDPEESAYTLKLEIFRARK